MASALKLFTLHDTENDFRIRGAVLARSAREAASILGGEYVEVEDWPPASSTNPDDLTLFGRVKFACDLFRQFSNKELQEMALDYNPGAFYEKRPGFVIWLKRGEDGREFVLRRNFVCFPEYVVC